MQKFFCFLLICFFLSEIKIKAQIPTTWSIDSTQGVWSYESDAIYFKRPGGILKADYNGNEIWAKQLPFEIFNLSIDGNSIYCLSDSCLYRLDTAGIIYWGKRFDTPVCTGVNLENSLSSVTANGNKIYVFVNQYNLSNYTNYGSIVVFDSLGNITNSNCDINLYSPNHTLVKSIKSYREGGWLMRTFSTGLQRGCFIIKIDSLGNFNNSNFNTISGGVGTWPIYGKIIRLPDSSYFVYNNYYTDFSGQWAVCTKFDEQANVVWTSTIEATGVIQGLGPIVEIFSATSDDSSNIYLSGKSTDNSDTSRGIVIKLNSAGNLVFTKAWLPSQYYIGDLFYHNGFIYASGGRMIYDTSFYSPCYAPDTVIGIIYSGPTSASGSYLGPYNSIVYSVVSVATQPSLTLPNSVRHDLCLLNEVSDIKSNSLVTVYPNPVTTELHIDMIQNLSGRKLLEVYSPMGAKVFSKTFSEKSTIVNCEEFTKGLYFLRVEYSHWSVIEKFIVE